MSIGEEETSDTLEYDPKHRAGGRHLTPSEKLERVAEIILDGGGPTQIKRAIRVPYHVAVRLHNDAYAKVWGLVGDRRDPEVLAAIKDENIGHLQNSIEACREEIDRSRDDRKLNHKLINAQNGSIKQLSTLLGHNAPTQIETTDRKVFALLNPAVHARVMADPRAREALVALEEFAAAQFDAEPEPEVVIDVTEGGDE